MPANYSWIKSYLLIHKPLSQLGAPKCHLDTQSLCPFPPSGAGHTPSAHTHPVTAQLLPGSQRSRERLARAPSRPHFLHFYHLLFSDPPGPFGSSLLTRSRGSLENFLKMWQICTVPTFISSRPKHPCSRGYTKAEERKAAENIFQTQK